MGLMEKTMFNGWNEPASKGVLGWVFFHWCEQTAAK